MNKIRKKIGNLIQFNFCYNPSAKRKHLKEHVTSLTKDNLQIISYIVSFLRIENFYPKNERN